MRTRVQAIVLPSEVLGDFADDVRTIFEELGRGYSLDTLAGECTPPIDVYETDTAIEVSVDLPGVDPAAVRILVRGSHVLVAGDKAARRGRGESTFHLVERGLGRFARTVRLSTPCDASRASAALEKGELRITLPKVRERRGRAIRIELTDPAHLKSEA
jgi:HSP20 family molecular chaperone IbpA